jgi:hypothetical protein
MNGASDANCVPWEFMMMDSVAVHIKREALSLSLEARAKESKREQKERELVWIRVVQPEDATSKHVG